MYRAFLVLLTRFNELFGTKMVASIHPISMIICFGTIHTYLRHEVTNGTKLIFILTVMHLLQVEYATIVISNVDRECKLLLTNFYKKCRKSPVRKKMLKSCPTLKFRLAGDFVILTPLHFLKYIAAVYEAVITALISYDNIGFEKAMKQWAQKMPAEISNSFL